VFSKGGYGSIPTVFAAWVYRIPVLLHETDLVPGLANRRLTRFASAIAVGFRDAERYFPLEKVFVSGTPLREIFEHLPESGPARARLGLHDRKPVMFITGGSQGAQRVNTAVLAVLPQLLSSAQILHQVGENNLPAVREFIEKDLRQFPGIEDYHLVGFLSEEDMALSLAAADLVVSRAGGTALAEISAAGKPSILIPLHEAAQRHQWENAYFFREEGAAAVLDETNLTPAIFLSTVQRVLNNPQDLSLMAERMRSLFRPGAAEDVAATLLSMARGQLPRREAAMPSAA
jgi:UDP-N-acetylglucosamine--N-acetylmuramyl-(pentapeptide) pyrophosphoryl-undecaprenol N-acetylglucosamine transferase